jgi:diguanylate cyclase (GGDEF)-like protein
VWLAVTTSRVRGAGGGNHWIEQVHDISALKRAEAALEKLAIYDPLTDLPNRRLLKDRIEQAMSRATQDGSQVVVVLVGLDRFRAVNDSLGHWTGDALLVKFADRLQTAAGNHTVARVGADVFAIVIDKPDAIGDPVEWARRHICTTTAHRYQVGGSELYIAFSTGVAFSRPGMTSEELIRNADLAMDRAKEAGGGQVVGFEERDLQDVRDRLALETDVRRAIADGQIQVAYQAVVRVDDHRVVAAEALARWHHPRLGNVPPEAFIRVLSQLGLTGELTSQVLRLACTQTIRWRRQGTVPPDFRVSVNLSADDVADPRLVETVRQALDVSGLEPDYLVLEVTETGLVRDTKVALDCLGAIRRLGAHLAVDDFGTGYSSLSYLHMFPVEIVKIDKSFVAELGRDTATTALVRGILSLTGALGLTAVAEGIETDVQLDALRQLGCGLAQGFFWSPPVPPDEFPDVVNRAPTLGPDRVHAMETLGPMGPVGPMGLVGQVGPVGPVGSAEPSGVAIGKVRERGDGGLWPEGAPDRPDREPTRRIGS